MDTSESSLEMSDAFERLFVEILEVFPAEAVEGINRVIPEKMPGPSGPANGSAV